MSPTGTGLLTPASEIVRLIIAFEQLDPEGQCQAILG